MEIHPWVFYCHAKDVIKGRWPEGEEVISRDPFWAYRYALDVIKGRCSDIIEREIGRSSKWSYYYARNIIKNRWREYEEIICSERKHALMYCFFLATLTLGEQNAAF